MVSTTGSAFVPPTKPRIRKPGGSRCPPVPTTTVGQSVVDPSAPRSRAAPAAASSVLQAPVSFSIARSIRSAPSSPGPMAVGTALQPSVLTTAPALSSGGTTT